MPYETSGSLTTDERTTSSSTGWDTQTEWEAYQTSTNVTVTNGTIHLTDTSAIPSETYEHNDLTGVYGGDTADYSIQNVTVEEGSYALESASNGAWSLIVRSTTDPFSRSGVRAEYQQYVPGTNAGGGVFFGTSVAGSGSVSGYVFYADPGSSPSLRIIDYDAGDMTDIASNSNSPNVGQWVPASVEFGSSSIDWTIDGLSVSVSDSKYSNLLLGAGGFNVAFLDDIQFTQV